LLWGRRRIQRLEDDIATAHADQAELRRRLEAFEMIARAAGAGPTAATSWGASVPAAPMPAGLLAAAREHGPRQAPVRLDVAGTEVIAVIGGPGDPREWWSAVWQVAGLGADAS
jgi:hypothetical protein